MAQVTLLKGIPDSAGWGETTPTDDITLNSFTGNGAGLTNLNMDNASSGILDKAFYDSTMAGSGLSFLGGVLSVPLNSSEGLGLDSGGLFVDYDGTTIGMDGTKLAVIGDFATNAFSTINFVSEDDILASGGSDTVNFAAGAGISFTTDALTNTITFESAAGAGYTAGDGLTESPAYRFNIDYASTQSWNNTQSIGGFDGAKLSIQGTATDADDAICVILDYLGNPNIVITQTGYISCVGIDTSGNTILGDDAADTVDVTGVFISPLRPDASTTRDLGDTTHRWKDLYIDSLIGSSKTVAVNNLVDKSTTETITGTWSFNGHVNLGDSTADTLTIVSVIDSNIIPDGNNTRTLGDTTHRWEDLFVDDIVDANGTSVATTTFQMIPLSGTSKPTANAASRGHVYTTEGGTGVADVVEVCLKSSTETYSWVNLATG